MKAYLKSIALLFTLVFAAVFAFAEAEAERFTKDPDVWMKRLAEIKIEWANSHTDGEAFRFSREDLTNELERTEKLRADFEKTFPKEGRKAKEKCVESQFVYFLESPRKAADFLLSEIAEEKDPAEKQTLYEQVFSLHYPYIRRLDKNKTVEKIRKSLLEEKDLPDLTKVMLKGTRELLGFATYDHTIISLWEKAFRAKDPETAVDIWLLFEDVKCACRFLADTNFVASTKRHLYLYDRSKEEIEAGLKLLSFKDNFLKYLKEEAPYTEADFYKQLADVELESEKQKKDKVHMNALFVMDLFAPKVKPLNFKERKTKAWRDMESKYASEAASGEEYPAAWSGFWLEYRTEANWFGYMSDFMEDLLASVEKHPGFFEPVEIYCEVLAKDGKEEECKKFLQKHYPEEKLLLEPENLQRYVMFFRLQEWDLDEKALVKKIFNFWLEKDPEKLAEGNQYLWERLWTKDYRELRKEVRAKLMECPEPSDVVLKRLEEITAEQDFEEALKQLRPNDSSFIRITGRSELARKRLVARKKREEKREIEGEAEDEDEEEGINFSSPLDLNANLNLNANFKRSMRDEELEKEKDPTLDAVETELKLLFDPFDPLDPMSLQFMPKKGEWDLRNRYWNKKFKDR